MALRKFWNKGTRMLVILLSASILTFLIVLINIKFVESKTNLKKVVVAKEAITPFADLKDQVEIREVVTSQIPQDAFESLDEFENEGKWFASEIGFPKGYPINKAMLVTAKDAKFGPAIDLDGKSRFVGVKTDQIMSAGDYIKPGVLVDAVVYIEGDAQTPDIIITSKENPLLKNLLVYDRQNSDAKEPGAEEGKNRIPVAAILKASPEVAAALVGYQEQGKVYLLPAGYDSNFYIKKEAKK